MSACFLARLRIHDPAGCEHYLDGCDAAVERCRGVVPAVDGYPES
jgi:hypothetical protein